MKKIIAVLFLAAAFLTASAQTAPPSKVETEQIQLNPTWLAKTSADASALLGDFGLHVTTETIQGVASLIFTVFVTARLGRKGIPDSWQTGRFGYFLKHAALEVNPDPPSNPQPQTKKENEQTS